MDDNNIEYIKSLKTELDMQKAKINNLNIKYLQKRRIKKIQIYMLVFILFLELLFTLSWVDYDNVYISILFEYTIQIPFILIILLTNIPLIYCIIRLFLLSHTIKDFFVFSFNNFMSEKDKIIIEESKLLFIQKEIESIEDKNKYD